MKKYLPHLAFAAVVLAVMLPLYQRGFIFALDMVFSPHVNLADYMKNGAISADLPIAVLIKILGSVLPMDMVQKIILSLILFSAGFLMFRLAEKFLPRRWAAASGLFYLVNPYVYERFLAGQWYILLGYALFPLLVKLFLEFLEKGDNRSFAKFAIFFSFYPIFALHWAYIVFWFLLALMIADIIIRKRGVLIRDRFLSPQAIRKYAIFLLIGTICFLLVNSFWLLGFRNPFSTYHGISSNDFEAFRTQPDKKLGVFFNVLSLYGFWNNEYFSVKDFSSYWWILTLVMLVFALCGVYWFYKKACEKDKNDTAKILVLVSAVCFIPVVFLSVGYGSGITKPIIDILSKLIPGFKGLRETEKLSGLLAFFYAILVPLGGYALGEVPYSHSHNASRRYDGVKERNPFEAYSSSLLRSYGGVPSMFLSIGLRLWIWAKEGKYRKQIFWLVALIPFFSGYTMFWGFDGQLVPHDYPASWYEADQILVKDKNSKLLFLPWRGYPNLSFAGNYRISNPAPKFFNAPVVVGKNVDNAYISEDNQKEWNEKMFQLLQGFETLDQNIDFLRKEGITHIALMKESDYKRYGFLEKSARLKKVLDADDIVLYEIRYAD